MVAALIVSVLAGITIVTNRMLNAELGKKLGILQSTLFNYITGLLATLLFWFLSGELLALSTASFVLPVWIYTGGLMGVAVVTMSNFITPRISAFYMTLLLFVAQILTGVLIDYFIDGVFSPGKLLGGVLVLAGLVQNMMVDRESKARRPAGEAES